MIQDHSPIPIDKFLGLFGIDEFDDSVPGNYFIDELNTITKGDRLATRDGVEIDIVTSPIKKFVIYRRQSEAARILALIGESVHDLTTGVNIYTASGMTDFAVGFYNNRAFISPHNGVTGLPGAFIQVYNGVGVTRSAGGLPPSAGFVIVQSVTAGVIEKGKRLFAWVFETDSGFVTGPNAEVVLELDGEHAVDISNIPIGPSGTAARRLIASRAIQDYNGNPLAYEMFFVPDGRIPNNTVTVLNGISFYDVDLQLSADYVYDQLETLPAVLFICTYGKRMCYGAPNFDRNSVWISDPLEPERIHSSAGFVTFDPFETEGVKDGTEFRDNLFICKRDKTYTARDNGYEPSTWRPVTLDSAIGCDVNGIARYYDATGSRVEFFTVSSPIGLFRFNGTYEDVPVSRNFKNFWDRINPTYMNKCVTLIDQSKNLLYMTVPLEGEISPTHLFVCNFENGFQFNSVKWHMWQFPFEPTCIGIDKLDSKKTELKISSLTGNIYKMVPKRTNDEGIKIRNYVKFGFVAAAPNAITHIGAIAFRIKGFGLLKLELLGQDEIDRMPLPSLNLVCMPGKEFTLLTHFQSEKVSLRIEPESVDHYFYLNRINMFANVIYNTRPLR
jgi:hypothetical protein